MRLFLDLDGTLTDPGAGISRCIEHALVGMGRASPPREDLARFVGPPLRQSLAELLGCDDASLVERALSLYREEYSSRGLLENAVYPGIPGALQRLRAAGHPLFVVTAKPHVYARRILDHFSLTPFFQEIYGCELSGERGDKGDLIRHVLEVERMDGEAPWMIGDRRHDVEAAHRNGLPAAGVLWGYGSEEELRTAGADRIFGSVDELCAWAMGV